MFASIAEIDSIFDAMMVRALADGEAVAASAALRQRRFSDSCGLRLGGVDSVELLMGDSEGTCWLEGLLAVAAVAVALEPGPLLGLSRIRGGRIGGEGVIERDSARRA